MSGQRIEVVCPYCGNLNRQARRACRDCNHTGKVSKTLWAPDEAAEPVAGEEEEE